MPGLPARGRGRTDSRRTVREPQLTLSSVALEKVSKVPLLQESSMSSSVCEDRQTSPYPCDVCISGTAGSTDQPDRGGKFHEAATSGPCEAVPREGSSESSHRVAPANGQPLMLIWEEQSLGSLIQVFNFVV